MTKSTLFNKKGRDLRVLVTGADDLLQGLRQRLLEDTAPNKRNLIGEGIVLCLCPLQGSDIVLHSRENFRESYDCVLYLFDEREMQSEALSSFLKIERQGVPTIAVFNKGHSILERVALRLGAISVVNLSDSPDLSHEINTAISCFSDVKSIADSAIAPNTYLAELRKSELQYRNLVQLSGDIIWSVDEEGRWTFVNDAVRHILGFEPREMLGRRFTEFQDPSSAARDLTTFADVLDGKRYLDYETKYRHKDGHTIVLSFNAIVLYGDNGSPIGATGTAIDISEKRKAAENLRAQKEFFRQVVNTIPNPLAVRNLRGQFVLVNKAFAHTHGYEADQLIGLTFDEVLEDNQRLREVKEWDAELLEDSRDQITSERKTRDKSTDEERWYLYSKKILHVSPNNKKFFLDVAFDLSDRKRSEEALRQVIEGTVAATAEDYFQLLVEHLSGALSVHSAFILAFSDTHDALRLIATHPEKEDLNHIKLDAESELYERLLNESVIHIPENASQILPPEFQNEEITSLLATLLRDQKGNPIGIFAVTGREPFVERDLPEYLLTLFGERACAELLRIRSERETKQLERQLQQAQKMEAIGTLAAGVAHDLNNSLSAIAGHLQLLEGHENTNDDQKHSLNVALDGCSRASRLVHQLLGFSRQGRYLPEEVLINESFTEMIEFLNCATRKDVTVIPTNIPKNLSIYADKNQFQQVLMNLIINSQQAMPNGGSITLKASTEYVSLPEQFNPDAKKGEYTVVSVSDNGEGIDPKIQDKIFEPFFTTKPAQVGTGLGLSMVYGIMQNHGGWVSTSSNSDKGSTFSLYFPKERAEPLGVEETGENEGRLRVGKELPEGSAILVIDDESFLVDLTSKFLERSGFRAVGFTDPIEAIEWFNENHNEVGLTILDMRMPQLDGKNCFKRLREIDPEAQVIILSGYIQDLAAQQVMAEGALRYFQKPLRYSELIDYVKELLSESQEGSTPTRKVSGVAE